MKKGYIILIISAIIIAALIAGGVYFYRLSSYKKIVEHTVINDVDLSEIEDGIYEGSYDAIFVAAKVRVTVRDNKIEKIELLEHKTDKGKNGENVIGSVLDEQSIEVDAITGATNSSKVILKAIENALSEGL